MSNKQKRALEKITGKPWGIWHPNAVRAYFSFTDRGRNATVISEAVDDFNELMESHRGHSITVEMWKTDFKAGLLFLDDFIGEGYPAAYVKHAFEIYRESMGSIPSKYQEVGDIVC